MIPPSADTVSPAVVSAPVRDTGTTPFGPDEASVCTNPVGKAPDVIVLPRKRADSPDAVFGPDFRRNSFLSGQETPRRIPTEPETAAFLLDGLFLLLFFAYALLIYRFRNQTVFLLKAVVNKTHLNAVADEQSLLFRRFVSLSNLLGCFALILLFTRIGFSFLDAAGIAALRSAWLIPTVTGCLAAVALYRLLLRQMIAKVGLKDRLMKDTAAFNRIVFTFATLFVTPAILLTGFVSGKGEPAALQADIILLSFFGLYYLTKSYNFFTSRNVSILPWFLYLCAVEILPISFFILLALRDFKF